jgi:tetratricopeptide (TPR) repeat protein
LGSHARAFGKERGRTAQVTAQTLVRTPKQISKKMQQILRSPHYSLELSSNDMSAAQPPGPLGRPSIGTRISPASWVFGSILLALVIAVFGFAPKHSKPEEIMSEKNKKRFSDFCFQLVSFWKWIKTPLSLASVALASAWWWRFAGRTSSVKAYQVIGVSLACFMVGALVGFVVTSYGEEAGTIGKVRDWLIGGITALTAVQAVQGGGVFKKFLLGFTYDESDHKQFGLVLSMAIVYFSLGFLFMFRWRELTWNVQLAKARAERGSLDGSRQTTVAVQKLLVQLPPDILMGVQDISETDVSDKEKEELKSALYQDDVNTFLKQADEALKSGVVLGWEDIYKVANIHYYRAYFEPQDHHIVQVKKALQWISRALAFTPLHADLTMKYADMLGEDRQKSAAVAVLENLVVRPESPAVAFEWLGYYLRSVPSRLDDSIRYSDKFLALFLEDNDTKFNLAYAYGAKYCQELKKSGKTNDLNSPNRKQALELLRQALAEDPQFKEKVAECWIEEKKGFECMRGDPEFDKLAPEPPHQK